MNNISIAAETISITQNGFYTLNDKKIHLPENVSAVEVITPETGASLIAVPLQEGEMCRFLVTNEDSFQAAHRYDKPFVMNFANAHHAGGGFLLGANAQEEALCRCSTLYASINSPEAAQMYRYNNTHISAVESDFMLYSPNVCVFRDEKCSLLETPFSAAVITVPAPNRRGAALLASGAKIKEAMTRRIRIMLKTAAKHGHKNLVLGAWGCGAFGNKPDEVAAYFKEVLFTEGYGRAFDEVCFAVYGSTSGRNYSAFSECFSGL